MLNRIIAFSVRNKLIVGIMVIGLIVTGVYHVTRLPIDAVPDITNNQVMVITTSPSLGAADIERLITFPIEQATINIPGIEEQRSFSRFGLSLVTIVFNDGTDVYWARQQVSEKLTEIQQQIPPGLGTPSLAPVTTGLGEIFQYVIKPKPGFESKYDVTELRTIQDWMVRRQLLGTPGVADVSSFGGKLKQYEIAVNYDKLRAYNLTINDIFSALEQNNQNTGGAYIEKGPTVLYIRSEGLVKNREDISNIMIKTLPDKTPVAIRDVAHVQLGAATRYGALAYNDQGEVAGAIVMMLKGANSSKVIRDVKEKISQIEKTLPEGIMIEPFLDRTKMVNNAISTVEKNLLEGALIVVFVLVLFLGNLRAGFLVASVIPLSMLFAIIMMNLFGVSGNLMSLGALDFGLIIDGAVIIVEAVMHHLHKHRTYAGVSRITQDQLNREVESSAGKLMNAAVFGQVIILIVYLPILSLQGIEGKMFKPMAQTVAFAILGAFLLSLTYIPMMSSWVLSKKLSHKDSFADKWMNKAEYFYKKILIRVLAIPKLIILGSVLLLGFAFYILGTLGGEFIPKLEEGDFAVDTRVLTGSSLTTTLEYTQKGAHILLTKFPEVEKVVTKIGSGEIPTDPMSMEASDMMVILKPKKQWTSARTFDELAEKMSKALEDVPGITVGFQFPVQMRFNELMTGGRQDVVCKIFGEDLDSLAFYADKIGSIAGSVSGAKDLYVETVTGLPQIVVDYNRAALSQYGLSVEDANKTLQAAFAGAVSGQVFENERRFDLVVRLADQSRRSLEDVQNLLIATRDNRQIPLKQVADVQIKVGPNQIQRENAQRRISVGFNVRGRDVESVVNDVRNKIETHVKLPAGYYITYGGEFENLVAARARLSIAVPVSLLLIFVLLYFAFHSLKQGLLVFSAIPLSAIGGVIALWVRGMPFSISAGVGFIALFGVAVLNGIVLMTEFNQLKKSGVHNIRNRIFRGATTRLRPVLMTAAVASLGFLPMALSKGAGAEVQRPLATVVIGGLVTATLLTLLVLPILYLWLETRKRPSGSGKGLKSFSRMGAFLLPFLAFTQITFAQKTIRLDDAVNMALNQNLNVQAAKLNTMAAKEMERSAWDIPLTGVAAEYGKMNSVSNDTRFTLQQTVSFPAVYQRRKELFEAQTTALQWNEKVVAVELRKRISQLYSQLVVMQERISLLEMADSLYSSFFKRQEQRFKSGDVALLEKTTSEAQYLQVRNQLFQQRADLEIVQSQFSEILNSTDRFLPIKENLKFELNTLPDSSLIAAYPDVKLKEKQTTVALQEIQVAKSQSLPQIALTYFNQSLIGIQNVNGVDKTFTGSNRFSSGQLGLNIPVFNRSNKARTEAAKKNLQSSQVAYDEALLRYKSRLQQLLLKYQKDKNTLRYFEEGALKQAVEIRQNASLQLSKGAINYMEWIMAINQSIAIQANYLNAIEEWNNTLVELKSFENN